LSMRSSSEPMAVDASRGARRAASAASSRPSSAEAEGTRRAPLRRRVLSSPCTSGVPATRGARLGRPVGSPRRARRAFTGPRHAIRAGGSRCACVAMVRRARAFPVCVSRSLTHAPKPFRRRLGETTPAPKNSREASGVGGKERGGRGGDARVPRDDCDGQLDDTPSLGSPACFGRSSPRHDHHARPHTRAPAPKSTHAGTVNPKADSRETPQQPWMENWHESRVVRERCV
jgi:hypothetical protein